MLTDPHSFDRDPHQFCLRNWNDKGTSNFKTHIDSCCRHDPQEQEKARMQLFASGSSYTRQGFRVYLLEWVARCNRPFKIVEDEPLRLVFSMLNGRVETVTGATIRNNLKRYYELSIGRVRQHIAKVSQRTFVWVFLFREHGGC